MKQAQDDQYIHFAVSASFVRTTSEKPSQVYISLRKRPVTISDPEKPLGINSYGRLNKETGLYEITFDISKDLEMHFNGEYDLTVHAADYRADGSHGWQLGSVRVWFKEGLEEGSNSGIKAEYKPLPIIEFHTPAPPPQISLLVSVLFFLEAI